MRPEGTGALPGSYTWNGGACCGYAVKHNVDDVGFLSTLIEKLAARPEVDPTRIFICGMSNGGMLTYRIANELGDKITAACVVASSMNFPARKSRGPVPVIAIHGMADRNVPYSGGVGANAVEKISHWPLMDAYLFWKESNVLNDSIELLDDAKGLFFRSPGDHPVEAHLLYGGGHTWPGGVDVRNGQDGPLITTFDANAVMWEFFSRFTR